MTKQPIHALIALPWYKPAVGGVVHGVSQLVERLPARGVKLTLLLQQPCEHPTKLGEDNGVEIFGFNTRVPLVETHATRSVAAACFLLWRTVGRLRRFAQSRGINVANVHYPSAQYVYFGLLRRWSGLPLVVSFHGSDIMFGFDVPAVNRFAYRQLLCSADAVTSVSSHLMERAKRHVPGLCASTHIIPGGARDAFFAAGNLAVDPGIRPFILCVARLNPVKGHDTLLAAYRQFIDRNPDGPLLMLAGGGECEGAIRSQIRNLGLSDRVVLTGNVSQPELARMNRESVFTVLTSRSEGLPLTVIEAFATGRTVIASDVGGVSEIVKDGQNGFLVPADNASMVAEKMTWLCAHPEECRRMGKAARETVSQGYTWDANADAFARVLREQAAKRR